MILPTMSGLAQKVRGAEPPPNMCGCVRTYRDVTLFALVTGTARFSVLAADEFVAASRQPSRFASPTHRPASSQPVIPPRFHPHRPEFKFPDLQGQLRAESAYSESSVSSISPRPADMLLAQASPPTNNHRMRFTPTQTGLSFRILSAQPSSRRSNSTAFSVLMKSLARKEEVKRRKDLEEVCEKPGK